MQFVFEAGLDAGLAERAIERRGVPLALQYAAVQLCDDLSDGDCDYLRAPTRTGPLLLLLLQNLFVDAALAAHIAPAALRRAGKLFTVVGSGQHDELACARWTYERSRRTAASITGHQLAAYLELLWDRTKLAPRAFEVGLEMGTLAHITTDLVTHDARFWSLPPRQRARLRADARAAATRLFAQRLPSVDRAVTPLLASLSARRAPPAARLSPRSRS